MKTWELEGKTIAELSILFQRNNNAVSSRLKKTGVIS